MNIVRVTNVFLLVGILCPINRPQVPDGAPLFDENKSARIGDNPFPTNPLNDRAVGYLLQGKAQTALTNYGNYIDIEVNPNGVWGEYAYLYEVTFLAGVPGHSYSSNYLWELVESFIDQEGNTKYSIWESDDAYEAWYVDDDTVFAGILFNSNEDNGLWEPDSISRLESADEISAPFQWCIDTDRRKIVLSSFEDKSPNESSTRIGLIYPWALRPSLISREDQFDYYDYGPDFEEWTKDDRYAYYGANTAESCLSFFPQLFNTDWQPVTKARVNTHNMDFGAGDIFGDTYVTDPDDTYPLLAHSGYSDTWPLRFNYQTGEDEPYWPGWWAQDYNIYLPGCDQSRKDPDCWETVPGRFISDMDVYMEFDDRWAHRANQVSTNNEYEQTGYPMGLRVMSEAHSYGVSYAEDILFVTVKVRNESGDWCAEDENYEPVLDENGQQKCGEAMIMPDGTKLNQGKGFDYSGVSLGFWMDGVILSNNKYGDYSYWTSAEDFMKYYWEFFEVNNERMSISMATIGDYDGMSLVPGYAMDPDTPSPGNEFGVVATQLLDSPKATDPVDLDQDGVIDIFPGEPLKMTDWHWLDWYRRPGVTHSESLSGDCYAGTQGCPQARNREEIFYKLMVGDTTNLSESEREWHFHTSDPGTDLGSELNPHFDSVDGIKQEPVFLRPPEGVDPIIVMSCGPFDLPVGREVPFSFCIIFGQDEDDLINNARFAQVMYNSRYQGFTPPTRPTVHVETDTGQVKIFWNDIAENSKDVLTGYSDFEGYKLYKSKDGGINWGDASDMIYDDSGVFVGWRPVAQFDLSRERDSLHCVYRNAYDCDREERRGHGIQGPDPFFPWFSLGSNTGLDPIDLDPGDWKIVRGDTFRYMYQDYDVVDGVEYTYSVVAYDMGVEPAYSLDYFESGDGLYESVTDTNFSNPNEWASPDGYASIENSKGTTILDRNFVKAYPGVRPQNDLTKVSVVPNPYIVRSGFKESEFGRRMRFINLPEECRIRIFTISGELVSEIFHSDRESGNAWWDMRSMNNQEIAPGLYVYHVSYSGSSGMPDEHLGKFAVIR